MDGHSNGLNCGLDSGILLGLLLVQHSRYVVHFIKNLL